jgi:hypothetical protein
LDRASRYPARPVKNISRGFRVQFRRAFGRGRPYLRFALWPP